MDLEMESSRTWKMGKSHCVLKAVTSGLSQEKKPLWSIAQEQEKEAKRLNYSNMKELVDDVLRIDSNQGKDFELTISNIAKIKSITFDKASFEVGILKISGLKNLQLNIVQKMARK